MAEKEKIIKMKVKAKKAVKKSFFEVEAPLTSTKIELYSPSMEELDGKSIKIDLTKNLRGKNLELKLRIKKEGEKLLGEPEKVELMGAYVRRAIRKGIDYCEDSFELECRDCTCRIKPFLLTRRRVSRSVLNSLRDNTKKWLEAYLKTRTGQEIISEIIANKIQKQLSLKLKKIYPLALCEIRVFEITKKKQVSEKEN